MALRITRKKVIIFIVALVLIGGGIAAYIFKDSLFGKSSSTSAIDLPATAKNVDLSNAVAVSKAADTAYYTSGDEKGAIALYDAAIQTNSSATDKTLLVEIYISKGILLLNAGRYSEALATGKVAEALLPNDRTAMIIAEGYAGMDDKTNAIAEYKIAIERAKALPASLPPQDADAAAAAKKAGNTTEDYSTTNNVVDGYTKRLEELQK
jgi:tetratricopeptide (TPR) repeat protein